MSAAPVPAGYAVHIDAGTRLVGDWLVGGSPTRALRLSDAGLRAWDEVRDGLVTSAAARVLARRLTDINAAHPQPCDADRLDVTIVIPVRDRASELARCLASVRDAFPVVVVDDASSDSIAVRTVCERYGARLVRLRTNMGPAAARNAGLDHVASDVVAFIDSDCTAPSRWIERLVGHFADGAVAAVAPRVRTRAGTGLVGRYAADASSLDLGARPARVTPGSRVSYVPTAALLVRRAAVVDAAVPGGVFDTALRVGEDVDLVWRLDRLGWRVRYEPQVVVTHHEPGTLRDLLRRRYRYGTSAAALERRHPGAVGPLVIPSSPHAGRADPRSASSAFPLSGTVLHLLDDAAYGTGVLVGCMRQRHFVALRPRVRLRRSERT